MTYRIDLVVPGLCGPLPSLDGLEKAAQPLVGMLLDAQRHPQPAGYERQLGSLFGVDDQNGPASAPCSLLGHGYAPGDDLWIHADPVFMQADMGHALMFDSHGLDISEDESTQLVELFNSHFESDGLSLLRAARDHWYLSLPRGGIETTPIDEAVGRNVDLYLPRGEHASYWRALLNETQMLFHGSEVNDRRETRGLAAVNSLWLWGEGRLPDAGEHSHSQVYARDMFARGLAHLHGVPVSDAPSSAAALLASMQAGSSALLVLKTMHWPACYGDAEAWLDGLADVQREWLTPLIEATNSDGAKLTLYPCNGISYGMRKKNRLTFWRRGRLEDYIDTPEAHPKPTRSR